ncbi:hypothetical protein [Plantibacter sp. M259]|uniref:hypothetical protein n=1 Tax=Plantibacter sp. M259 TaxID=2583822 RepID=UPI00197BF3B6|nr:hypothetical protein [Plantibacter sp. M259]
MMHHLFTEVLLAVTPSPSPSPAFDENQVTPGPWGFMITFAIAGVVVFLVIDMVRRVRRVNYRAEIDERLQAEVAERAAADRAGSDTGKASPAGVEDDPRPPSDHSAR